MPLLIDEGQSTGSAPTPMFAPKAAAPTVSTVTPNATTSSVVDVNSLYGPWLPGTGPQTYQSPVPVTITPTGQMELPPVWKVLPTNVIKRSAQENEIWDRFVSLLPEELRPYAEQFAGGVDAFKTWMLGKESPLGTIERITGVDLTGGVVKAVEAVVNNPVTRAVGNIGLGIVEPWVTGEPNTPDEMAKMVPFLWEFMMEKEKNAFVGNRGGTDQFSPEKLQLWKDNKAMFEELFTQYYNDRINSAGGGVGGTINDLGSAITSIAGGGAALAGGVAGTKALVQQLFNNPWFQANIVPILSGTALWGRVGGVTDKVNELLTGLNDQAGGGGTPPPVTPPFTPPPQVTTQGLDPATLQMLQAQQQALTDQGLLLQQLMTQMAGMQPSVMSVPLGAAAAPIVQNVLFPDDGKGLRYASGGGAPFARQPDKDKFRRKKKRMYDESPSERLKRDARLGEVSATQNTGGEKFYGSTRNRQ